MRKTQQMQWRTAQGVDGGLIRRHTEKAQASIMGEHQLEEYVAALDPVRCVETFLASPESLPFLAARRDECRVGPDETRSFEEVIEAWTPEVLSSLEGG